jgi:uncharacterized protein YrzB (UPF0473 family)
MKKKETLETVKRDWATPKTAIHNGENCPFLLQCTIVDRTDTDDIVEKEMPESLMRFWEKYSKARLFEDVEYGQWGLNILAINEVTKKTKEYFELRNAEAKEGDYVVGEFLGDSDILIVRCDKNESDYGNVIVALPIDPRKDWYIVSEDFGSFLEKYMKCQGDKYWERSENG